MQPTINIIIAEDSELYRQQVASDLKELHITTIAEASNGRELLMHLANFNPDVVLLDLKMPELNGNDTMALLTKRHPSVKVIILSSYTDQYLMEDYMLRGARGYISKDEVSGNIKKLASAIKRVHEGGFYRSGIPVNKRKKMTARQIEIINHYSEGHSKQQIASHLKITRDAIYKQEKTIMEKLGVRNGNLVGTIFDLGLNFIGKRFDKK